MSSNLYDVIHCPVTETILLLLLREVQRQFRGGGSCLLQWRSSTPFIGKRFVIIIMLCFSSPESIATLKHC